MKEPHDGKDPQEALRARLNKSLQERRASAVRRRIGARATRQQFLEATRNVGVIVVATCFTAGWVVTNPSLNTDNVWMGVGLGILLIFVGSFGYGYVERDKTSDEESKL
ncbi:MULTISPECIES: hypothetical protein [Halomonadaceae]|uniref:Uncharacterized protein n=2 Tax=Vreelandella TaxID=3137766 RepID=A0A7Z0RWZ3_9GAMM|nr:MULTISPECIES: hypothetical protein [Halomonas]NYS76622.1 hypothetical protein [Halomonas glaciei]